MYYVPSLFCRVRHLAKPLPSVFKESGDPGSDELYWTSGRPRCVRPQSSSAYWFGKQSHESVRHDSWVGPSTCGREDSPMSQWGAAGAGGREVFVRWCWWSVMGSRPPRAASGLGDTSTSGLNRFRLGERAPPPALLIKILHVQAWKSSVRNRKELELSGDDESRAADQATQCEGCTDRYIRVLLPCFIAARRSGSPRDKKVYSWQFQHLQIYQN
jgi:hypothetical protein